MNDFDILPASELMERDFRNLESVIKDGKTRVEIYQFANPSITAGRFAKVEEETIERWKSLGHDFARRPTGGGILRHEKDLCFGVAFISKEIGMEKSYRIVSNAVQDALKEQGVATAPAEKKIGRDISSRCFDGALGFELLFQGKKILGLAGRRIRNAVLIQGSLIIERDYDKDIKILGTGPEIDLRKSCHIDTLTLSLRNLFCM